MRLAPVALLLSLWLGVGAALAETAAQVEPAGLIARLGSDALRHAGPIHALAFSPDGRLLACGGEARSACSTPRPARRGASSPATRATSSPWRSPPRASSLPRPASTGPCGCGS